MSGLDEATRIEQAGDGLRARIDPAWDIWGPCGGYLATIALRAAGLAAPGHRPVALSCQYLSRASQGEVRVTADVVKPGSAACVNVALEQNGQLFLQAQVWTTSKDQGPRAMAASMPDVPGPNELPDLEDLLNRHGQPILPFLKNFDCRPVDYRLVGDADPKGPQIERWQRYRDWTPTDDPFLDAGRSVIAIDTHIWMAHVRGLPAPADYVAPSLDLSVWFHQPAAPAEWLLVAARSDVALDGLIHGLVRVWTEDGRLAATGGSQCLVLPLSPRRAGAPGQSAFVPRDERPRAGPKAQEPAAAGGEAE